MSAAITVESVQRSIARLFLPGPQADGRIPGLRHEDLKKSIEVAALLTELARIAPRGVLVDAAAGHAYLGLLAVDLLAWRRVVLIERDARRVTRCHQAIARLGLSPADKAAIEVHEGDVAEPSLWPAAPHAVVALHACGAASDAILDAAVAARARWLLLVPCCYARSVRFSPRAEAHAEALGVPRQPEVRRHVMQSLIDAERTLRLEAAGYEVTVAAFVPPTVTPHNLVWRARYMGEPKKAADSRARWLRLWSGEPPGAD